MHACPHVVDVRRENDVANDWRGATTPILWLIWHLLLHVICAINMFELYLLIANVAKHNNVQIKHPL